MFLFYATTWEHEVHFVGYGRIPVGALIIRRHRMSVWSKGHHHVLDVGGLRK